MITRNYAESNLSEAAHQGEGTGRLSDWAAMPSTAESLRIARAIRTRERWEQIRQNPDLRTDEERRITSRVWDTLPGESCLMDVLRLICRPS